MSVVLRNHTPHPVVIDRAGSEPLVLDPVAPTPRVVVVRDIGGVLDTAAGPVRLTVTSATGEIAELPPARPGVLLVVARAVAEAAGRDDLVFPDDLVRDEGGNVVGCRALGTVRRSPVTASGWRT